MEHTTQQELDNIETLRRRIRIFERLPLPKTVRDARIQISCMQCLFGFLANIPEIIEPLRAVIAHRNGPENFTSDEGENLEQLKRLILQLLERRAFTIERRLSRRRT